MCLFDGNFVISVGGARNTPAATLSVQWALDDARNSAVSVRGSDETVAKFTIVNGALESVMNLPAGNNHNILDRSWRLNSDVMSLKSSHVFFFFFSDAKRGANDIIHAECAPL